MDYSNNFEDFDILLSEYKELKKNLDTKKKIINDSLQIERENQKLYGCIVDNLKEICSSSIKERDDANAVYNKCLEDLRNSYILPILEYIFEFSILKYILGFSILKYILGFSIKKKITKALKDREEADKNRYLFSKRLDQIQQKKTIFDQKVDKLNFLISNIEYFLKKEKELFTLRVVYKLPYCCRTSYTCETTLVEAIKIFREYDFNRSVHFYSEHKIFNEKEYTHYYNLRSIMINEFPTKLSKLINKFIRSLKELVEITKNFSITDDSSQREFENILMLNDFQNLNESLTLLYNDFCFIRTITNVLIQEYSLISQWEYEKYIKKNIKNSSSIKFNIPESEKKIKERDQELMELDYQLSHHVQL
jgi:hypothetical protein